MCHLVELLFIVGEIEVVEIGEERLFVALSFLISGFESGERGFGREGAHHVFFEFGQLLTPYNAQEDIAIGIEHEEVGKSANVVALGDGCVGALAHVDVEVDEIVIHVVGKLGIGEDVLVHAVAGDGPVGEAVEEDGLLLGTGARQGFIERIDIVEFDVGFDAIAIHARLGLCEGGQRRERAHSQTERKKEVTERHENKISLKIRLSGVRRPHSKSSGVDDFEHRPKGGRVRYLRSLTQRTL